ncbi:MAG: tRNA (N(6)-L-threonylcarbamoyladenosine(37)-C(2))-methylthiotransferase MtaB [Candidatus Omnitrophota bacterium]
MNKKIKLCTLGCKVNQYESQAIRESFIKKGFNETANGKADIYIINTCTVTQTADRKSREYIYRCRRENPKATLVVTGCYAQDDLDRIEQIPGVDFIISNSLKNRIADIVIRDDEKTILPEGKYQDCEISDFADRSKAFIKIQDGCDNRCSYCKVSLVRGPSRSRDLSSIIREAGRLIDNGFQEIVLTGICLGAYGRDLKRNVDLLKVIEEIEGLDGDFRIRLSSIEARDVTDKLISKIANSPRMCRHLHIPFQSGDDEVLKLMDRKYSARYYKELVGKIRKSIPEIAITTDIMVGFPHETERRFQNTFEFLKDISPSRMHIFPYSPRQGTAAFSLPKVEEWQVKKRLNLLRNLAREKSFEYRNQFLNKELIVLIEASLDRKTGLAKGYCDNYIKILIENKKSLKRNNLQKAKIIKVTPESTFAESS